jgi:hypothetical protein
MPEDILLPIDEGASPETQDEAPSLSEREAKKLKARLRISERYREREFKSHYETSLRLYKGKHWPERSDGASGDESRVIVNMVYPMVQTKVSTIGFRYPEFTLTPLNLQSSEKARLATAAMRYEWKISRTQREVCRALHDKEIFGVGVVQTGWEFRTKSGVNRKDGREETAGELGEPLDFEAMARAVSEEGAPSAETPEEEVIVDQFYCKRISPWNFLVDPEGDWVLDNHEYVAYCEMVPLTELRKDPRLKNTRELKGNSKGHHSFLDQEYQGKDEQHHPTDIKRVKVYHYYEKKRQLYAMFTDEHDKPLLVERWSWEHGRYPFRVIHSPKLQDCWYDQTPVELIQSQQEEINVTRTMLRNHMRRFTRKFSCARGMLDRNAKQQLKSAIDGGIVEHNGGPEAKVIMPIDHAPIPAEVYKSDEWAIRDIRYATGLDEYDLSSVGKTRRTAQEVAQIRQAGGSRAQADAQTFEMFCAEVGEDLLDLMMQFATKIQEIPIYGPNDNIAEWSNFSSDDIKGEYLVDVYVGSTQPKNRIEMQQQYIGLLQILAPILPQPNPSTGLPYGNVQALIKGLLQQFPDIHNIDEILTPDQPPMMPPMGLDGMQPMPPMEGPPQGGPPLG